MLCDYARLLFFSRRLCYLLCIWWHLLGTVYYERVRVNMFFVGSFINEGRYDPLNIHKGLKGKSILVSANTNFGIKYTIFLFRKSYKKPSKEVQSRRAYSIILQEPSTYEKGLLGNSFISLYRWRIMTVLDSSSCM